MIRAYYPGGRATVCVWDRFNREIYFKLGNLRPVPSEFESFEDIRQHCKEKGFEIISDEGGLNV